ncbi:MAG TPA: ABC transporter ATP-binding protein [Gemmatimonadaceae bacterium]|nr:ABC transporter ATP-binding protein [Gemmatimonadaceae bacterium]
MMTTPATRIAHEQRRAAPGASRAPSEKKKVDMSNAWAEARELIWRNRSQVSLGLGLMLINRLAGLVLPASPKLLIDRVIGKHQVNLLMPIALVVVVATLVQAGTTFALSQVMSVAAQRAIAEMRKRVNQHVLRLPVSYFDGTQTGILISRILNDAEGIRNLVGTGLVQLSGGLVTAVLALGVLFWLNWSLTTITLLILITFGGGMAMAFTKLRPIFRERSVITADVTGRLSQSLSGIRVVKTYIAERREQLVFARGVHRLLRNIARTITGVSALTAFTTLIVGAVGVLMIVVGGHAILAGTMTLGDFVTYVLFIGLVAAPLVQIASIGTQISEAFAGLDRIREIRMMATEDEHDAERGRVPDVEGDVRFEDVSFSYAENVPVLRDISFHAPAGSTTALVGSSGAGKSTLISLIMAFNHPQSGRILIDGRDLADLRLGEYRSHLGVVLQDNFLFDGTVAENIGFSKPGASAEEIRAAARAAHCDEFISRFTDGYETVVGERGVRLSGGERQRVAIARAILADPRILILDEATSSLDSESEALIRDGLRRLRRGRTTFVIAHRLSTIASADQILVLEEGRIVERGTQDQLLAAHGRYRQLYDKQYGLEVDRFVNPGEDFTPDESLGKELPRVRVTPDRSL